MRNRCVAGYARNASEAERCCKLNVARSSDRVMSYTNPILMQHKGQLTDISKPLCLMLGSLPPKNMTFALLLQHKREIHHRTFATHWVKC